MDPVTKELQFSWTGAQLSEKTSILTFFSKRKITKNSKSLQRRKNNRRKNHLRVNKKIKMKIDLLRPVEKDIE